MEIDELDDLYRETILDHCRNPHNTQRLEDADISADAINPFCGDEIHLQMSFDENGRAERVGLQGIGCSINQASGSMLSDLLYGKTLNEMAESYALFRRLMNGEELSEKESESLGDLRAMVGVRRFPVRIKCALLSWSALEDGLREHSR